eukprot:scaffold190431_cov30-Tisochrysis_lutea.AAC.1
MIPDAKNDLLAERMGCMSVGVLRSSFPQTNANMLLAGAWPLASENPLLNCSSAERKSTNGLAATAIGMLNQERC